MAALSTKFAGDIGALGERAIWVAALLAAVGGGVCSAVRSMATLSAQLLCQIRAFGEGTVGVAVSVAAAASRGRLDKIQSLYVSVKVLDAAYIVVTRAVRSVTALGGNFLQLILWQVRKVRRVGRSHC
jgi:hypothetical protein